MVHGYLRLAILAGLFAAAAPASEGPLPRSWYELPEDAAIHGASGLTAEEPPGADGIDRILRAAGTALDRTSARAETDAVRGWRFTDFLFDLSVSGSGMVGAMLAKGDATAELYWRRMALPARNEEGTGETPADAAFRVDMTRGDLKKALEPVVSALLATGEVKDAAALKKNLLDAVWEYHGIAQGLGFVPGREWTVSRLRLELAVEASGKVTLAFSAGGGVRLRFDWEPCSRETDSLRELEPGSPAERLRRLLGGIGHELRNVKLDPALGHTGFGMNRLRLGIGIFGEGQIGIVKAGASVMGYLYFTRCEILHPIEGPPDLLPDALPILEGGVVERHLEFARDRGIAHEIHRSADGSATAVYYLPKDALRKGIEKAVRMGTFFAERAVKHTCTNWELHQVNAEFALSISGYLGLVNLGGTAAVQLRFQKGAL